jgi:hypothetical protein
MAGDAGTTADHRRSVGENSKRAVGLALAKSGLYLSRIPGVTSGTGWLGESVAGRPSSNTRQHLHRVRRLAAGTSGSADTPPRIYVDEGPDTVALTASGRK